MTVRLLFRPDHHVHVFHDGRVAVLLGDARGRSGDRQTVLAANELTKRSIVVGSIPADREHEYYRSVRLASDDTAVAALSAATQGDFSRHERSLWERPVPDSVSVFVPESMTPQQAAQIMGIPYVDTPSAVPEDEDEHPIWFRPLDPHLFPAAGTDLAARLTSDTKRWGGFSAWEVVSWWEFIGPPVLRLAKATDLALITVLDRYRDREHALRHGRRLGDQWSIDWRAPDEDDERGHRSAPFARQPGAASRPEPGPTITSPLVDHVIIYDDGAIFTAKATTVAHRTDNPWFDNVLAFEAKTNTGDTLTLAWLTTPGLAAVLQAPTLPHPTVNDLLLATTAGDLTWLDGRNPLDYLTHPLQPAS